MQLDHAVVAAADLEWSAAAWTRHGFTVEPGGRHPDWGTSNALIRLDRTYIELIAVHDEAAARAAGPAGRVLLEALAEDPHALVGYAVAVDDITDVAERLHHAGLAPHGPFAMARDRPDGNRVSWQLVLPQGRPWLTPWPFFIRWDGTQAGAPSSTRHRNGARDVTGITLRVPEPAMVAAQLQDLGAGPLKTHTGPPAVACPPASVRLRQGSPAGPVGLTVSVNDLAAAAGHLGMAEPRTPLRLSIDGVRVELA